MYFILNLLCANGAATLLAGTMTLDPPTVRHAGPAKFSRAACPNYAARDPGAATNATEPARHADRARDRRDEQHRRRGRACGAARGFAVRALHRDPARARAAAADAPVQWMLGDAMRAADVTAAAAGADLIFHGAMCGRELAIPMLRSSIAAARASGARLLFRSPSRLAPHPAALGFPPRGHLLPQGEKGNASAAQPQ